MNQNIIDWLASESSQPGKTKLERIAELWDVNGGPVVGGYGMICYGGGRYGRGGLEQDEAYELMAYSGGIQGIVVALGDDFTHWFIDQLKKEWEKQESLQEANDEQAKQAGEGKP